MKHFDCRSLVHLYLILFAISLFLFFILTHYIFYTDMTHIQQQIYRWIEVIRTNQLSNVMILLTKTANPIPVFLVTLLLCLILVLQKFFLDAILVVSTMGCLSLAHIILKHWFSRERPTFTHLIEETGYSFPSGHAMISFGFAILITYLVSHHVSSRVIARIISMIAFFYSLLIGFSRLYVSVHYLGDVLGGFLAATAITCLLLAFFERSSSLHSSNQKEETR